MSLMENIDKELRTAENELTLDFGFWTFIIGSQLLAIFVR